MAKLQKMPPKERNLLSYATQTRLRSIFWFTGILIFVGLGLVWYFYGFQAALFGLLCILGFTIPILLITIALFGLDFFLKHIDAG